MFAWAKTFGLGVSIFTAIALCMSTGVSAAESATKAKLPLEGKTLNVAFSVAPPFVIVENNFQDIGGIDVSVVRELQRRTGFSADYELMNFSEMMNLAQRGEVDVMGGGIYANEERSKTFDFTDAVYRTGLAIVSRKGSGIDSIEDLANKTVAVEMGTSSEDLIPNARELNINTYNTPTSFMAFYYTSRGVADATIVDIPLAESVISTWGGCELEISYVVPNTEADMALILKKGTEETKLLQAAYKEMLADGTVARIVDHYKHSRARFEIAHADGKVDEGCEPVPVQAIANVK